MTKFGLNGFTESLRQEVTRRYVRVGVLEQGKVDTELVSHNSDLGGVGTTSHRGCTDELTNQTA
jgi:short-subunit dehydrogenase